MSATGRSNVRNPDDFYATPAWATRAILKEIGSLEGLTVLEPGCGDGAILEHLSAEPQCVVGVELDAGRAAKARERLARPVIYCANFLEWANGTYAPFDLVIGNPPYKQAREFVEAAMKVTKPGGRIAMLLRLGFLASAEREEWLRRNMPDVYVLPKRPSFCMSVSCKSKECGWHVSRPPKTERPRACERCGGKVSISDTDACDYGWFVWHKDGLRAWQAGRLRVLGVDAP